MPKISIIIPIYNVERYLENCLKSILNQSFEDMEVILVDDGSIDNSGAICDEYSTKDNRVKVIHKLNGGLSSARNTGLDMANGEYIGFIDSDDYVHPQMFEILYNVLNKDDSDISICDFLRVNDQQIINKIYDINEIESDSFTPLETLKNMCKAEGVKYVIVCNKLYKRSIFKNVRFPQGKIHEDEFLAHKLIYAAKKVSVVGVPLYYYFQNKNGIMGKGFTIKSLDMIEAYGDRMKLFKKVDKELVENTEYFFVVRYFSSYKKFISDFQGNNRDFEKYKLIFNKNLMSLLKNNHFSIKEKLAFIIYYISPKLYYKYIGSEEVHRNGTNNINNSKSIT